MGTPRDQHDLWEKERNEQERALNRALTVFWVVFIITVTFHIVRFTLKIC